MNPCSVQNIHPIFHVQRHPLWTSALDSLNMEDYSDFDFDNTPSSKKKEPVLKEENLKGDKPEKLKSEFYDSIERVGKSKKQRVVEFRTECNFVEDLINRGDKHVAKVTLARMRQLRNELEGIIDVDTGRGQIGIRPPSTPREARKLKHDKGNHSSINHYMGGK